MSLRELSDGTLLEASRAVSKPGDVQGYLLSQFCSTAYDMNMQAFLYSASSTALGICLHAVLLSL